MKVALIVVSLVMMAVNGTFGTCQYDLDQCQRQMMEYGQKLSALDARLSIMEARQESIATEFKGEMTTLDQDVGGLKTVTNTLVEDNVKTEGKIRILQGVDGDVRVLNKRVEEIGQDVSGTIQEVKSQIEGVSARLKQEADANQKITVLISSQMKANDEKLNLLSNKMAAEEGKRTQLESKVDGLQNASGDSSQIRALSKKIEDFERTTNDTLEKIQGNMVELNSMVFKN